MTASVPVDAASCDPSSLQVDKLTLTCESSVGNASDVFSSLPRPVIDHLCREVLRMKLPNIVRCALEGDVFLDSVLDHLISRPTPIISDTQKQDIKTQPIAAQRFRRLVEYLRIGGLTEFIEFRNAIEGFSNLTMYELAAELRMTLDELCAKWRETERVKGNTTGNNLSALSEGPPLATAAELTAPGEVYADGGNPAPEHRLGSSPGQTELNIVLLGKTGDGKTTLVNGLANYVRFRSFTHAFETDEHCLPMKIRITNVDPISKETCIYEIGGNPPELKKLTEAKFGDSVTQVPNTFSFQYGGRSVRLIDTPGFSSTQEGPAVDEKRMHTIVNFIKDNCKDLNAVCIVSKANEWRRDPVFIHTIRKILENLAKEMADNIIICMTNSSTIENYHFVEAVGMVRDCVRQLSGIDLQTGDAHFFENETVRVLTEHKLNKTNRVVNLRPFRLEILEDRWRMSVEAVHRLFHHVGKLPSRSLVTSSSVGVIRQQVATLEVPLKSIINCIIGNKTELLLAVQKTKNDPNNWEKFVRIVNYFFTIIELPSYVTVCRSAKCVKITDSSLDNGAICHENCAEYWWTQKCEKIKEGICSVCDCDQSFHRRTCLVVKKEQKFIEIPIDDSLRDTVQRKLQEEDVKLRKYIKVTARLSMVLKTSALSHCDPRTDNIAQWLKDLHESYGSRLSGRPTGDCDESLRLAQKELNDIHQVYVREVQETPTTALTSDDLRKMVSELKSNAEYGDVFLVALESESLESLMTSQSCAVDIDDTV